MTLARRISFVFLAIAWMAIIFYMSSIPDLKSGFTSLIDLILRKCAHMAEYAMLYILIWKSLEGVRNRIFYSAIITLAYALSDEYHQGFVHNRVASPADVLIDSVGMAIGYAVTKNRPRQSRQT